jgi:hypothetical protein
MGTKTELNTTMIAELLVQALEHERGGVKVYTAALSIATNEDLKREWMRYLAETQEHERELMACCTAVGFDPELETPGRTVVRHVGNALVDAILMASQSGDPAGAQIVACECVVLAETKDHLNWQLIGKCAEHLASPARDVLRAAYEKIEDQEDAHLYHTKGWCRELWLSSLGLGAVLPPPEERRDVKTAIGQAKAEQTREQH